MRNKIKKAIITEKGRGGIVVITLNSNGKKRDKGINKENVIMKRKVIMFSFVFTLSFGVTTNQVDKINEILKNGNQ